MRLVEVGTKTVDGYFRLYGMVQTADEPSLIEVYFEYPVKYASFIQASADPFLPVLLFPCMNRGEDLTIDPPVSPLLLNSCIEIQEIYKSFIPELKKISINATAREQETQKESKTGVGAFFSMGVDSFYTLLKHQNELPSRTSKITHLLFMEGLEGFLGQQGVEKTVEHVSLLEEQLNVPIIVGRTNLRDHFEYKWDNYCGAGLAGTALSLSGGFHDFLVPAGLAYKDLMNFGSHPVIDEKWSTEYLRIIHDGCEASRTGKIIFISKFPIALENLRLCYDNNGGCWNCGQCGKCIRTMTVLEGLNVLKETKLFPDQLPKNFEDILIWTWGRCPHHAYDYVNEVVPLNKNPQFNEKIKQLVKKIEFRIRIKSLAEIIPGLQFLIDSYRFIGKKLKTLVRRR